MNPPVYTRAAALPEILRQRLVILDGAMGTMIQQLKLGEAQYRGERKYRSSSYFKNRRIPSRPYILSITSNAEY